MMFSRLAFLLFARLSFPKTLDAPKSVLARELFGEILMTAPSFRGK